MSERSIEAGTTDDKRDTPATEDLTNALARPDAELTRTEGLVGISLINEVVRGNPPLCWSRLRSADVKEAVDLTRIGGDDLGPEHRRQTKGGFGLAGGRRSDNDGNDGEGWCHGTFC